MNNLVDLSRADPSEIALSHAVYCGFPSFGSLDHGKHLGEVMAAMAFFDKHLSSNVHVQVRQGRVKSTHVLGGSTFYKIVPSG